MSGVPAGGYLAARQRKSQSIAADLQSWMRAERTRLSRHAETAKAIDYMLKRWPVITRFLDDGRICLSNNAAERSMRGIALRPQAWLFAASGCCGERAAMYTLIATAKINNLDPKAWLPDLTCSPASPSTRPPECMSFYPGIGSRPISSRRRLITNPRGPRRMLTTFLQLAAIHLIPATTHCCSRRP